MTRVSGGDKLLTIRIKFLKHSASNKAFKAALYNEPEEGEPEIIATTWLPHSVVKNEYGNKVDVPYNTHLNVCIPLWLAEADRFDFYFKEQLLNGE